MALQRVAAWVPGASFVHPHASQVCFTAPRHQPSKGTAGTLHQDSQRPAWLHPDVLPVQHPQSEGGVPQGRPDVSTLHEHSHLDSRSHSDKCQHHVTWAGRRL